MSRNFLQKDKEKPSPRFVHRNADGFFSPQQDLSMSQKLAKLNQPLSPPSNSSRARDIPLRQDSSPNIKTSPNPNARVYRNQDGFFEVGPTSSDNTLSRSQPNVSSPIAEAADPLPIYAEFAKYSRPRRPSAPSAPNSDIDFFGSLPTSPPLNIAPRKNLPVPPSDTVVVPERKQSRSRSRGRNNNGRRSNEDMKASLAAYDQLGSTENLNTISRSRSRNRGGGIPPPTNSGDNLQEYISRSPVLDRSPRDLATSPRDFGTVPRGRENISAREMERDQDLERKKLEREARDRRRAERAENEKRERDHTERLEREARDYERQEKLDRLERERERERLDKLERDRTREMERWKELEINREREKNQFKEIEEQRVRDRRELKEREELKSKERLERERERELIRERYNKDSLPASQLSSSSALAAFREKNGSAFPSTSLGRLPANQSSLRSPPSSSELSRSRTLHEHKLSASELLMQDRLRIFSDTASSASASSGSSATTATNTPKLAPVGITMATSLSTSGAKASPRFDEMLQDLSDTARRVSLAPTPLSASSSNTALSYNGRPEPVAEDPFMMIKSLDSFTTPSSASAVPPSPTVIKAVQRLRELPKRREDDRSASLAAATATAAALAEEAEQAELSEKERSEKGRRERVALLRAQKELDDAERERRETEREKRETEKIKEAERLQRERIERIERDRIKEAERLERDRQKDLEREKLKEIEREKQREFDKERLREAERLNNQMEDRTQRDASITLERSKRDKSLTGGKLAKSSPVLTPKPDFVEKVEKINESVITPTYIRELLSTLQSDSIVTPDPSDFSESSDGYSSWQQSIGKSFQGILCDLLNARYIDANGRGRPQPTPNSSPVPKPAVPAGSTTVEVFFKIVQARNLTGSKRNTYAIIEYGDEKAILSATGVGYEKLQTEVSKDTTFPVWNQHISIPAKNLTDIIAISVFDSNGGKSKLGKVTKDEFLGRGIIVMGELITASAKAGYVSRWCALGARSEKKDKDKNSVGGEVLIEMTIHEEKKTSSQQQLVNSDPEAPIRKVLLNSQVNLRSVYKTLLRACLALDMNIQIEPIKETTNDLLSIKSKAVLSVFGRQWALGEAFRTIALLEILFKKYKGYEGTTTLSQRTAFENLRENMKRHEGWLSDSERPALLELFEEMREHYTKQVSKYRDFFPKNVPQGALESTLIMLRMIHKNSIYREAHPDLPESFRDELRNFMTIALIQRYQALQELAAPFDSTDIESVISGILKFVELLTDDIESDTKYFQQAFSKDTDIAKLTAETYLKYLVLTLENHVELFVTSEAMDKATSDIFALYKRVRDLDLKYAKLVPSLKRSSMNAGFSVERWFHPFVTRWLEVITVKTLLWVKNAVDADRFQLTDLGSDDPENDTPHSESITTVLKAVYEEFEFITDLKWSNTLQNAGFLQSFAKMVNRAIELYCDAIAIGETKDEMKDLSLWSSVTTAATTLVTGKDQGPSNIAMESCVKLCNIEYATVKLEEMYKRMDVAQVTQNQRNYREHRRTMAPQRRMAQKLEAPSTARPTSPTGTTFRSLPESDSIRGAIKFEIAYGENIKACLSSGMANPYLVIRVPDGTVVENNNDSDDESEDEDSYNYDTAMGIDRPGKNNDAAFLQLALSNISMAPLKTKPAALIIAADRNAKNRTLVLSGADCDLAKSRVVYATVNPAWDESFEVLLPPVNQLSFIVYSKNLLTSDEVAGKANLDLGVGSRLRRRLIDHQTHEVFLELEPQGRVAVRMTLVGEDEDVEFWFRRSRERLVRNRDDFVRALNGRLVTYIRTVVMKAVKSEEAAPLPTKGFLASLTQATILSNFTVAGTPISEPMRKDELENAAQPLNEYLDRNLATLCESLSGKMAHEVIKRIWDEFQSMLIQVLIPPLFGLIERDRRILNPRQISLVDGLIRAMSKFFHADGQGLGLSREILEKNNRKFKQLSGILELYNSDLAVVKSSYEASVRSGVEKEYLLRVVRLKIEKDDGLAEPVRIEERKWIEKMIAERKRY
ncbi:hypothetical protein HK096_002450 [Nowakowskiella sp. JEL0078]|nr:hypothetical protein HK096_002450 [Nowakowskiella sp. JEL0078]